jgi:hypothetical protein
MNLEPHEVEALLRILEASDRKPAKACSSWTIHYTELPASVPGSALEKEWKRYRRELPEWLAAGLEGKWVLIKGEEIVGTFPTREAAREEAVRRWPTEPSLTHQINEWEPIYNHLQVRQCPA